MADNFNTAGFEDGGSGPGAKECGWSPEAAKGKKTDSPHQASTDTLILAQ